jgi:hypothetical protein
VTEIDAKSEKKLVSKLPKFYMEKILKKATELYQRMTEKIAEIVQQSEKAEKNEHLPDSLSEEFCQLLVEVSNIKSKLQSTLQSTIFLNGNDSNFSNYPSFFAITMKKSKQIDFKLFVLLLILCHNPPEFIQSNQSFIMKIVHFGFQSYIQTFVRINLTNICKKKKNDPKSAELFRICFILPSFLEFSNSQSLTSRENQKRKYSRRISRK